MLAQLLQQEGCEAWTAPTKLVAGDLLGQVEKTAPDVVCISVVAPSTVIHARYLCLKLRAQFPKMKIVIGLWDAIEGVPEANDGGEQYLLGPDAGGGLCGGGEGGGCVRSERLDRCGEPRWWCEFRYKKRSM